MRTLKVKCPQVQAGEGGAESGLSVTDLGDAGRWRLPASPKRQRCQAHCYHVTWEPTSVGSIMKEENWKMRCL